MDQPNSRMNTTLSMYEPPPKPRCSLMRREAVEKNVAGDLPNHVATGWSAHCYSAGHSHHPACVGIVVLQAVHAQVLSAEGQLLNWGSYITSHVLHSTDD